MKTHVSLLMILFVAFGIVCSCAHTEPAPEPAPKAVSEPVVSPSVVTTSGIGLIDPGKAKVFVEEQLVARGVDRSRARALVADPRVAFDEKFILKNLNFVRPKPSSKTPGRMEVGNKYISKGREFIEENQDIFDGIEEVYEISPEIIMAILIIETRIGTYPMKYNVFNVYANISLISDPEIMARLKEEDRTGVDNIPLEDPDGMKKTLARGRWAAGELCNLIVIADTLGLDPLEIKGSVGGALGPAQFIPSTFVKWGADGDEDGIRNPFVMADAIASIANLLKKSGWRENGDEKKNRTAIWLYNHSDIYVNTVLKLYEELLKN